MFTKQPIQKSKFWLVLKISFLLIFSLSFFAVSGFAQTDDAPLMQDYKGVKIGMTADQVREKLGKPKTEDKEGFFYVFSDKETAQVLLGSDHLVNTISVTYSNDFHNPPTCEDVFGKGVEPETRPSGSLYKMIRFPKEGYWVAYSRLAGDEPTVSITMNKF